MKKTRKAKTLLIGLAAAGFPLITTATCNPRHGTLDFYRNDDHDSHGFFDVFIYDDYYYEDCYYWDDCYYEEIILFD
jgi:hypothetical protein